MSIPAIPHVKEIKPINFLFLRTRTKVHELGRFVGVVARELYRDAVLNDLEVTGPVYWNYVDYTGDETKSFVLEIALPVSEIPSQYSGKFQIKRSETFFCVSLLHAGSWYDLPGTYEKLTRFISQKKLQPVRLNREIYINMDFINPAANVTEIQMGISSDCFEAFQRSLGITEIDYANAV